MKIHIVCPIWGESFIALLDQYTLPLHTPSIFGLPGRYACEVSLHIYTRPQDAPQLELCQSVQDLREKIGVFVHFRSVADRWQKLFHLTIYYEMARQHAVDQGAVMITLQPDGFYPGNGFEVIIDRYLQGYALVLSCPLPVSQEQFLKCVSKIQRLPDGRDFASLCIDAVHREHRQHMWDGGFQYNGVDQVFWELPGGNGFLCRNFRYHPVLIDPSLNPDVSFEWTPDVEYARRLLEGNLEKLYLVTDSDEMVLASLMPDSELRWQNVRTDGLDKAAYIAKWAQCGADTFHRAYFKREAFVRKCELTESVRSVVEISDKVVDEILSMIDTLPNCILAAISQAEERSISIFGAGSFGGIVSRALRISDISTVYFLDNDKALWGDNFMNIPIFEPTDDNVRSSFVIIASTWFYEISRDLVSRGFVDGKDFIIIRPSDLWSI